MLTEPLFTQAVNKSASPDPLGTASANTALYRSVFPGINNTVRHIRIYSAICWMIQRVRDTAKKKNLGEDEVSELFDRGLQKIQLLLTWCNTIHGVQGMPGANRKWPEDDSPVDLSFNTLLSRAAARLREQDEDAEVKGGAAFLTAPEYEPSIMNGLRFIQPSNAIHNGFVLTDAGKDLAAAYGAHVAAINHKKTSWFSDPSKIRIRKSEVYGLHELLRIENPSTEEKKYFLANYFPRMGAVADAPKWDFRHRGLTLALRALAAEEHVEEIRKGFVSVDVIRHAMARGFARDGTPVDLTGLEETRGWWASLQLRQYLRLALDILLRLTEVRVHDAGNRRRSREVEDICAEIGALVEKKLPKGRAQTISQTVQKFRKIQRNEESLYLAGIRDDQVDICNLVEQLLGLRRFQPNSEDERLAACGAYQALVFCAIEAENLKGNFGFETTLENDRLSLDRLSGIVDDFSELSPEKFISYIVQHYVIGLHFTVVRERTEDDIAAGRKPKNRYRIVPGDQGLERNILEEREFVEVAYLEDLLRNALLLLSQAGLLIRQGMTFKLTKSGRVRLPELVEDAAPRIDAR